jgi:hypothetical protein
MNARVVNWRVPCGLVETPDIRLVRAWKKPFFPEPRGQLSRRRKIKDERHSLDDDGKIS